MKPNEEENEVRDAKEQPHYCTFPHFLHQVLSSLPEGPREQSSASEGGQEEESVQGGGQLRTKMEHIGGQRGKLYTWKRKKSRQSKTRKIAILMRTIIGKQRKIKEDKRTWTLVGGKKEDKDDKRKEGRIRRETQN